MPTGALSRDSVRTPYDESGQSLCTSEVKASEVIAEGR